MTTIAWIVTNGAPVDSDYTRKYSNIRFYTDTIAAVCSRLKPKKLIVVSLKRTKNTELREGWDCERLKARIGEESPTTELSFKDWDDEEMPKKFSLGFTSGMWSVGKAEIMRRLSLMDGVIRRCEELVYLDSDHELDDEHGFMPIPKYYSLLKHCQTDKATRKLISEVWTTEGPPGYMKLLKKSVGSSLYCPYICYELDPVKLNKNPKFKWVFLTNARYWTDYTPFFKKVGPEIKWYLSRFPPHNRVETAMLSPFGITTERTKFFKKEEVPLLFREGVMTFHLSRAINRFSSKMSESLAGGVITTIPKIRHSQVGDMLYSFYEEIAEDLPQLAIDCKDVADTNKKMIAGVSDSDRKAIYKRQLEFHNSYFHPRSITKNLIESSLL